MRAKIVRFASIAATAVWLFPSAGQDYGYDQPLYVASSVAVVRAAPRADAPAAGRLPIGTPLRYVATVATAAHAVDPDTTCPGFASADRPDWICVQASALDIDGGGWLWHGWIAPDLLTPDAPVLADLLARYDATASDDLAARRKWAERAAALEPTSPAAERRLLEALDALGDRDARAAAERSFLAYRDPRPEPHTDATTHSFYFDGTTLYPLGRSVDGVPLAPTYDQDSNAERYRHRGEIYPLYRRGVRVAAVVTESQFDCRVERCAVATLARRVPASSTETDPTGIALDYELPPRARSAAIAPEDRALLASLARAWITAAPPSEERAALLGAIENGSARIALERGQLSTEGRAVLFGNWKMGSVTDHHYNGNPYESLLIVAEQQADGAFRQVAGSGSLAARGCYYKDHLDLDRDGTDEIVLACEGAEGPDGYVTMKRGVAGWSFP